MPLKYFRTESEVTTNAIKVVIENEKVKVTEYVSSPGMDVCGKGMRNHSAHLSIMVTDAKGILTSADGKTQL